MFPAEGKPHTADCMCISWRCQPMADLARVLLDRSISISLTSTSIQMLAYCINVSMRQPRRWSCVNLYASVYDMQCHAVKCCLACCRRPAERGEWSFKYPAEPVLSSVSLPHRHSLWAAPPITLSPLHSAERPPVGAATINYTLGTSNRDLQSSKVYRHVPKEVYLCFWSIKKKNVFFLTHLLVLLLCAFSSHHPSEF